MSLTLANAIGSTDTILTVVGQITNASGPGIITIESEQIFYSGNSVNQFIGLVRGYNSTSAASHAAGTMFTFVGNEPVGVGDLNGTLPLVVSGGTQVLVGGSATVSMPAATNSVNGYMTSADHTRLNGTSGTNTGDETSSTIKTKLANLPLQLLASDPGFPTEGMLWYNTTSHLIKFYDGTTVQTVAHV